MPIHTRPRAARAARGALGIVAACVLLAGCVTTPTGRSELVLVPADQMARMGDQAFAQARKETPVSHDAAATRFVQCVAKNITALAPMSYSWQVTLFQSKEANAFALPGGHIGVYTGLLKYARTQDELAAVIGHEVGHVLARHADARVSTQLLAGIGLQAADAAIGGSGPTHQAIMSALGIGTQVGVMLPYSRSQESEADLIGLNLMSEAGFDPEASIQLWHNMQSIGGEPPAFLSDHPSTSDRIANLQAHMPQALSQYRQAKAKGRNPQCGSAPRS
ncbi:MAG TPA: M48 family metallopeptidase [Gammaproteobacteria bacterium]|nr:M48 family metallopeptidase [Gammaproteobacteria bacterium]